MPTFHDGPVEVLAAGEPPKTILEHVGRVSTGTATVSVAVMRSPAGWSEPAQQPEFEEHTVVLSGVLVVEHAGGVDEVRAGQAVTTHRGERVRYSTPHGAEYVSVCVPAFAPELVHRDA